LKYPQVEEIRLLNRNWIDNVERPLFTAKSAESPKKSKEILDVFYGYCCSCSTLSTSSFNCSPYRFWYNQTMTNQESLDPWTRVRTRHDLPADEVISALQKEIRRGKTENAALLAYEMLTTSPELEAKLWQRLLVISVEDIGWGDLNAPVIVNTLHQMHFNPGLLEGDRFLFAIHAVRLLCACQKDRSSSEMFSWLKAKVEKQGVTPEIPDYAIDMHTARGKQMGRGLKHFLEQGALVEPELADRTKTYREYLLKLLEKS
jgi:hypothetical protein